jgi:hypothetical protein
MDAHYYAGELSIAEGRSDAASNRNAMLQGQRQFISEDAINRNRQCNIAKPAGFTHSTCQCS